MASTSLFGTKLVEPPQPSAALQSLKSAHFLTEINNSLYPTGVNPPNPALNSAVSTTGRGFKYDIEFLLEFQKVLNSEPSTEFEPQVKALIGDTEGGTNRSASPKHLSAVLNAAKLAAVDPDTKEWTTTMPVADLDPNIPSRVICNVPLHIAYSEAKKDAEGVFTKKAAATGDLLFSIKQPLLTIINDGGTALSNTCDNCFAYRKALLPGLVLISKPEPELKFSACGRCKVVCYCDKACQKDAWLHHHKFECKAYLAAASVTTTRQGRSGIPVNVFSEVRYLIRLLCQENGPNHIEMMNGLLRLSREEAWAQHDAELRHNFQAFAEVVMQIVETKFGYNTTVVLLYDFLSKKSPLYVPLLKGDQKWYIPDLQTLLPVGTVVDPFVARIRHSCDASIFLVFEGNELRVRAARPIAAGEELTLCYVPDRSDYVDRRGLLSGKGHGCCQCSFCKIGPVGPHSALRSQVLRWTQREPELPGNITQIEKTITAMEVAGYTHTNHLMLRIQQMALKCHVLRMDKSNALKSCLKLYYLIEPAQTPPIMPTRHLDTLSVLVGLENLKGVSFLKPLPDKIQKLIPFVYFHHRVQLVEETEKWLGKDSVAAKFERTSMETALEWLRGNDEVKYTYRPLTDERQKLLFVGKMNELLTWAGVAPLGSEQLMG